MSLAPRERTFTMQQLRMVWKEGLELLPAFPQMGDPRRQSETAYCNDFRIDQQGEFIAEEKRSELLEKLCGDLQDSISDPEGHFAALDSILSLHFLVHYKAHTPIDPDLTEDQAIQLASQLLSRLPAVPPQIDFTHGSSSPDLTCFYPYLLPLLPGNKASQTNIAPASPWADLIVVSKISTVVARLALLVVASSTQRHNVGHSMRRFVNLLAELIDANEKTTVTTNARGTAKALVLQAFLWVTWQRSTMIFFWFLLRAQLEFGYEKEWNDALDARGCSLLTQSSVQAALNGYRQNSYMCDWAFQLLKSSRAAIGLDFRRFHQRYSVLHQNKAARCQFQSDKPCVGDHPTSCGRFQDKRLVREEQSLHDLSCRGNCKKLKWNESSYKSVKGPTAIALHTHSRHIKYTSASYSTLAISHVWSHGQGSRPNIGLNECLHKRYVRIAKKYKCDSYWIDSLCIPEEHKLRMEAIGFINRIFSDSKITLVCDRDIMDIDARNLTVEHLECILVTFFVCDWNIRAWTLLEAIRGNHAIYLLAQQDMIISLRDTLRRVLNEGAIDISILCLASQHLLPADTDAFRKTATILGIEEAANVLSHRYATRDGDEIVIWSLLSRTSLAKSAEEMWKSAVKRRITTAYLVNTTPRLDGVRGFSWAPSTPYISRISSNVSPASSGTLNSYEGGISEMGLITPRGLLAIWLVCFLQRPKNGGKSQDFQAIMTVITGVGSIDYKCTKKEISGDPKANECWQMASLLFEDFEYAALIRPRLGSQSQPYLSAKVDPRSRNDLFAVCASNDSESWLWKGVCTWPPKHEPPPMIVDELLIV